MRSIKKFIKILCISALAVSLFVSCDVSGLLGNAIGARGLANSTHDDNTRNGNYEKLKPNSIVVEFNACGGIVELSKKIVKHGPDYGFLPTPSKRGYIFEGWWTEPDGFGTPIVSTTKVIAKENHTLYAAWKALYSSKVYGTAVIGSLSIVFEFSLSPFMTISRSLVAVPPNGFLKAEDVIYPILNLDFDAVTGEIAGSTEVINGISFGFEGSYSSVEGYSGYIIKNENGVNALGIMTGLTINPETHTANYTGEGIYSFPVPPNQKLVWNMTLDFDAQKVTGTWCESCPDWDIGVKFILGTFSGTIIGNNIAAIPIVLPEYKQYVGDWNAVTEGIVSDDFETVAGRTLINSGGEILEGRFIGSKVSN